MSRPLNFPDKVVTLPMLRCSLGATAEGVFGRRNCARALEQTNRQQLALLHVAGICMGIYAGFWFQYVVQMLYGMPSLYVLSGKVWFPPSVNFYISSDAGLPGSLAQNFKNLSLFGSALAMGLGWHFTHGVSGKWRMRAIVAVFAGILSIWAVAGAIGEEDAWNELEAYQSHLLMELEGLEAEDEYERSYLQSRLKWLEGQLLLRPGEE